MHGPWHPILHNAPRSLKKTKRSATDPEYAAVIPNDYTWYRPLDPDPAAKEIRILFLEPEPLDSTKDVVVHVFNASLLDPNVPRLYGCLSYCWGDPVDTRIIQVMYTEKFEGDVDGKLVTTQTPFHVTSNLEAALRILRHKMERPVIWVDALCIDQSDVDERSSQVALMAEIYAQAMQVLIWLGEADQTTQMVFGFADLISKMQYKDHDVDPLTVVAGIPCGRLLGLAKGQLKYTEQEVEQDEFYKMRCGVQAILARPWFRRVWVLQEVAKSVNYEQVVVHCGAPSTWWSSLYNLTSWEWWAAAHQGPVLRDPERDSRLGLPVAQEQEVAHYRLPEIWSFIHRYCAKQKRVSILELIIRRIQIEATDPRDQVYALFGLARECADKANPHPGFYPDYSRTVAQTYTEFTRAVINKTNTLVVLSASNVFETSPTRAKRDLPSWVPEYDTHINLRQTFGFLGEGHYHAAGRTEPVVLGSKDAGSLTLMGVIIDNVVDGRECRLWCMAVEARKEDEKSKIMTLRLDDADADVSDALPRLWSAITAITHRYSTGEAELLEPFLLTLTASRQTSFSRHLTRSVADVPDLLPDFAAYWALHDPDFNALPPRSNLYGSREELVALAEGGREGAFAQRMGYTCDKRKLVVTESGRLALCPRETRNGDLVVVFLGGNVPYVLRRKALAVGEAVGVADDFLEQFELVGECYVHGSMFGSVMREVERGELSAKVFDLR